MTASFSSLSVDRKKVLAVLAAGAFSSRIRAGRRPTVSSRGASGSPNKMARIADVSIWREPTADYALLSNIDPSSAILKILLQTTVASQLTVPLQSALSPTAKRIRRPDINRSPGIVKIARQNPANPASANPAGFLHRKKDPLTSHQLDQPAILKIPKTFLKILLQTTVTQKSGKHPSSNSHPFPSSSPTPNSPPQTPPTSPPHPPPPHPHHAPQTAPRNPKHPPASTHIPCPPAD